MTATVDIHRLAVADFAHARRWYARVGATVEAGFAQAVRAALAVITSNPTAGTSSKPPYLWVPVRRYPYVLHYGPTAPDVYMVYAVAHTSRRPGYWLRRTRRP